MDESKKKKGKSGHVKCPLSMLNGSGAVNKATVKRIYTMGRFYGAKMTPILVHLVDEAWMDFIDTNSESPKLEMILTLEDMDSDTTPLSTLKRLK